MVEYSMTIYPVPIDSLYPLSVKAALTLDGSPYEGTVHLFIPGYMSYIGSTATNDGSVNIRWLSESLRGQIICLLAYKEGRPYSSELITPANVVVYDLAINTAGGGAPTGNPGTLTGKVERAIDGQIQPAARQLVAVENKPDGTWTVTGNTVSDGETGDYTLDVLTDGGDTYVVAIDDYGRVFTGGSIADVDEIIHPTIPNGHVYRVQLAGTLPDTEPQWWIDTGTTHTRTVGDVTLRAIPYYRPLCHGALTVDTH